jgi:hypothetical protein
MVAGSAPAVAMGAGIGGVRLPSSIAERGCARRAQPGSATQLGGELRRS